MVKFNLDIQLPSPSVAHPSIRWLVNSSARHPFITLLLAVLLAALSLGEAVRDLSIDTDSDHLFSEHLPWRQQSLAFAALFPQFSDTLTVVVRGPTEEETRETALALTHALVADPEHFRSVTTPGISRFFDHEGLLLLSADELSNTIDSMLKAGQLLEPLARDPSARGLFTALGMMVQAVSFGMDLSDYDPALGNIEATLSGALANNAPPLSWQALLTPNVPGHDGGQALLLIHPILDHGALEPGQAATEAMLKIAANLPDVRAGRVKINYTGSVPLSDEEFQSLTDRALPIAAGSAVLVVFLLFLALRSWRLMLSVMLTLVLGLIYTLGFAAFAVGRLNLVSVAFAVLFIGLAVDFGIQFAVRFSSLQRQEHKVADVLQRTGNEVGGQIGLAALATACGFLAFAPTSFSGMAELGMIAGIGMLLALVCTLTVLPALLSVLAHSRPRGEVALPGGAWVDGWLSRNALGVFCVFVLLAFAGLWSALTLPFDANPLHTKRQDTEAMQTLTSLMGDPNTHPFTLNVLAADLPDARALAARIAGLPEVAQVVSGADFIPDDQPDKLEQLKQALDLMYSVLAPHELKPPATVADLRRVASETSAAISSISNMLKPNSPLLDIGTSLGQLAQAPDGALMAADLSLSRFLPDTLKRLNDSLSAQPITRKSLPDGLARDWFTADGRVRVQITPSDQVQSSAGLRAFVQAVQAVAPQAVGPALDTVMSADTILQAFAHAAVYATLAIAAVLIMVLRRVRDVLLVMATLLMSALLTALLARALGVSINFANIIALPLLLGVGVSFNVYFVMNWRTGMRQFIGSATARAILFSALTTGTAFGSLAIARHPGTASMGMMLLLSLFAVLLSTFVFLPALLYRLSKPVPA